MTGKNSTNNQTLAQLADGYMQDYYSTVSTLGENHPTTKKKLAYWQALQSIIPEVKPSTALVTLPQRKTLFRSLFDWAKSILQKFNQK